MNDVFSFVLEPYNKFYSYIKKNFLRCFSQMVKITTLEIILSLVMILLLNYITESQDGIIVGVLFVILLFIGYISFLISSTAPIFVKSEFENEKFEGIIKTANKIKTRILKYFLAQLALILVLLLAAVGLPLAVVTTLKDNIEGSLALLFYIAIFIYVLATTLPVLFLTQFWHYNVVVGGFGVKEGLTKSIEFAKKKFFKVIVFDVILAIIMMIIVTILTLAFLLLETTILMVLTNQNASQLLFVIFFLIFYFIRTTIGGSVIKTILLPPFYVFWKKVQEEDKQQKTPLQPSAEIKIEETGQKKTAKTTKRKKKT